MIGQIPGDHWASGEEDETDVDGDQDISSLVTQSSRVYSPTPYLKKMVDMWNEGDEMLKGKKAKRKD